MSQHDDGYDGDGTGRVCDHCGYVNYEDEIDGHAENRQGFCNNCGRRISEKEAP